MTLFTAEQWRKEEALRIPYCRQASPELNLTELCRYYNLNLEQAQTILGEQPAEPIRRKRLDHATEAQRYATAHVYAEINVTTLADALEVSEPTARKIIDSRPDCFRRIRRGIWECRDAQADRQADKGK